MKTLNLSLSLICFHMVKEDTFLNMDSKSANKEILSAKTT